MAEMRFTGRCGSRRTGRALLALALCITGTGCYSYRQVSPASVSPGSSVRISVAQNAATDPAVTPAAGQHLIRCRLLPGTSPDTLHCAVRLRSSNIDPLTVSHDLRSTEIVPVAAVERLEVRRLDRGRTAGAVAAATVLGVVVVNWAFDVSLPGGQGGDDSGGSNNIRAGLFRLQW